MRTLVLIPTSRLVDAEMQLDVGRIPPAMIPVRGKPLYTLIAQSYSSIEGEKDFILVSCQAKELLEQSLRATRAPNTSTVEIPEVGDLGQALLAALERIDCSKYSSLIINFGDTIVHADFDLSHDTVYYEDLSESFRWTSFTEQDGQITSITDKGNADRTDSRHVFTGAFTLTEIEDFISSLRKAKTSPALSGFYSALQNYLAGRSYRLCKVKSWQDFGHVDNYHYERKKSLNQRFFNELSIDPRRPVITKRSRNVEKFAAEIRWYLALPPALKPYAPQVFDYQAEGKDPFVQLEFYGYPSIAELFLSGGHSLGIWNHVLDGVFSLMRDMRRHRTLVNRDTAREASREMYLSKTLARLDNLRDDPVLQRFFEAPMVVNGQQLSTLDQIIADLHSRWEELAIPGEALSVIHGDFCASNILFDPRSRIIKLIDPRGAFGPCGIYGDYRYDLAKLSHSFNGCYELIVSDAFSVICEGNEVSFNLATSDYQRCVADMFNRRSADEYGADLEAVKLLEALLFLSMVPLHADRLDRQLAMLATGIRNYPLATATREVRA